MKHLAISREGRSGHENDVVCAEIRVPVKQSLRLCPQWPTTITKAVQSHTKGLKIIFYYNVLTNFDTSNERFHLRIV